MIKRTTWLLGVALAGLMAAAPIGCKKSEAPKPKAVDGVSIDLPKLTEALQAASPAVHTALSKVKFGVRYKRYDQSLKALDTLAADPTLTDAQKQLVTNVTAQVAQAAQNREAATGAAK